MAAVTAERRGYVWGSTKRVGRWRWSPAACMAWRTRGVAVAALHHARSGGHGRGGIRDCRYLRVEQR